MFNRVNQHSLNYSVAFATASCGFRRIVVWHSPHRCVASATSPCGIRHGRHACNIPVSAYAKITTEKGHRVLLLRIGVGPLRQVLDYLPPEFFLMRI